MNSSIKVKICGITRLEDALDCVDLGADALGFVFYPQSKRYIAPQKAKEIINKLPPFVTTVGLFVNANKSEIENILKTVPLQLLQFHGNETESECKQFNRPYMKAIAIKGNEDLYQIEKDFASAVALLYDAYSEKEFGGTGKTFEWATIPSDLTKPWVLAGGLNPENITQAIMQTHAKSVDVSSGVERDYGVKDKTKIQAFISGVNIAKL
ncbi:phosphoribosylanthranilate isomerase [Neisseriaceae bacterium PsAf]|nr:phosphoribosylanthranilate isomerase [Neisseriaceae bacterium PsAf]MCV2503022.1 phosphoribosylanthranilate isomerase [Neisseriaceae bacterium]